MKLLIIGSQHGNELLGEKLYDYICRHHADLANSVNFYLANPKARELETRCIETDMNQSYVDEPASYEERRAKALIDTIRSSDYDLVLDCHTTTAKQAPCIIMYHNSSSVQHFIDASSLPIVVKMADEPAAKSLIGAIPTALSLEVAEDDVTDEILASLSEDIDRFVSGTKSGKIHDYYIVERRLLKSDVTIDQKNQLKNFELSPLGYYPMLVGEDAYEKHTDTLGFRMQKLGGGRV